MYIGQQLEFLFIQAKNKYPDLNKQWIGLSYKIGGLLPNSLLLMDIQRLGELDILLRCLELELSETIISDGSSNQSGFAFHYQKLFSDQWIGGMYEIFRLLRERKLVDASPEYISVFSDLEMIRIPLEKYEIAKDRKIKEPLRMTRYESKIDNDEGYEYNPKDNTRAHIMPTGISSRGSVQWHVTDGSALSNRWTERLDISDKILQVWK